MSDLLDTKTKDNSAVSTESPFFGAILSLTPDSKTKHILKSCDEVLLIMLVLPTCGRQCYEVVVCDCVLRHATVSARKLRLQKSQGL